MKNRLKNLLRPLWAILTEVPGWPDAPRKLRVKRLVPIAVPVAAAFLFLLWDFAWRNPRIQAERKEHQPLMALEAEVVNLRLAYSAQQTDEITSKANEASRILLSDPAELPATLDKIKELARTFGWDANINPSPAPTAPSPNEAQVYYLPSRGKLLAVASNPQPFPSLIAFLEKLPASDKWIDLTRMTLRADDQGKLTVEIYLRTGCRVPNEKAPQ